MISILDFGFAIFDCCFLIPEIANPKSEI